MITTIIIIIINYYYYCNIVFNWLNPPKTQAAPREIRPECCYFVIR